MRFLIASMTGAAQGRLLLEAAGEEAEGAAARHVGAGENDLADAPLAKQIRRVCRRDPSLAGAGGAVRTTTWALFFKASR